MLTLNGCFIFRMYEVTFENNLQWSYYDTKVKIYIDGSYIDTIDTNQETSTKLFKGDHSIKLEVYRKYDSYYITTKNDTIYVVGDETLKLYDDFFATIEFSSNE